MGSEMCIRDRAKEITPAISESDEALAAQDASTRSLINFYRKVREF